MGQARRTQEPFVWLAGGGIKGGHAHGETDEVGYHAVRAVVHHLDYHATRMHLFGLNTSRLTFQPADGLGSLLDERPGKVVTGILEHPPLTADAPFPPHVTSDDDRIPSH